MVQIIFILKHDIILHYYYIIIILYHQLIVKVKRLFFNTFGNFKKEIMSLSLN